jgi:hypothetical protein
MMVLRLLIEAEGLRLTHTEYKLPCVMSKSKEKLISSTDDK